MSTRVFKGRAFTQFARKNRVEDSALCGLIRDMLMGAIDADLGGGVYKQRLRRKGQGKSGSYRTIILLRFGEIALFTFGFAKNEQATISRTDLLAYRRFAKEVFQYDQEQIEQLVQSGALQEICHDVSQLSVSNGQSPA